MSKENQLVNKLWDTYVKNAKDLETNAEEEVAGVLGLAGEVIISVVFEGYTPKQLLDQKFVHEKIEGLTKMFADNLKHNYETNILHQITGDDKEGA